MKSLRAAMLSLAGLVFLAGAAGAVPGQNDKLPRSEKGACVVKCVRTMQKCMLGARGELRACRAACADEQAKVREACAENELEAPSNECAAALEAWKACRDDCHDGYKTDVRACGEANRDCIRKCVKPSPSPAPGVE